MCNYKTPFVQGEQLLFFSFVFKNVLNALIWTQRKHIWT